MKFQVKDLKFKPTTDDLVLTYFTKDQPQDHPLWKFLPAVDKKLVTRLFTSKDFKGNDKQSAIVLSANKGKMLLVGLGDKNSWNFRKVTLASRRIIQLAKIHKVKLLSLALELLSANGYSTERLTQAVVENIAMASYSFDQYKKEKDGFKVLQVLFLVNKMAIKSVGTGTKTGEVIGEQVNYARDLGNTPGGDMTPTLLAQKAEELGKESGFKVQVLGKKEMNKLKMGAILGVAKGSAEEPKFIIMEYYGAPKTQKPYVFIGKGVTFDSGGLNLKPDKGMDDMWLDMCGGAAVISAIGAIAKLKLSVNVVGLVPAVENMPGSASLRPGDLLKTMSGKTIEVLNTDAEGRIILADALTYAERFKSRLVIDVATLTGACMAALGLRASGLFTTDNKLQNKLELVGETAGDYVWPLPMWEEYEEDIKGTFGDIQNVGKSRYGDAINGAMFLYQFAKKYPWAHLDIAPTMKTIDGQFLSKGASGVGVRFLVELVRTELKIK